MRHRKSGIKLSRTASHRKAMFRNMVTSLFKHDRIQTTDVKAKELRSWADHLVTLAKRGDLHARRQALSIIREKEVVHKLFEDAPKRFGRLSGGYTRIVKLGLRKGDAAPMSLLELVSAEGAGPAKGKKKKKAAKAEAPKAAPAPAVESEAKGQPSADSADAAPVEEAAGGAASPESEKGASEDPGEAAETPPEEEAAAAEPEAPAAPAEKAQDAQAEAEDEDKKS